MGRQKRKSAAKKLTNRSSHTKAIMRAASHQQTVATSPDATSNKAKRATKRCSKNLSHNPPATKRPRHQGLTRNNVSRIAKLALDAINDDDTDQDAGETETPTVEETEDESITQEVQKSIVYSVDTLHSHAQLCIDACPINKNIYI